MVRMLRYPHANAGQRGGKADPGRDPRFRRMHMLPHVRRKDCQRTADRYRDHTPEDIRDIAVIRFENGHWSMPKTLYADKWKINACPTNAASAAAKGERVAIAWYTGVKARRACKSLSRRTQARRSAARAS